LSKAISSVGSITTDGTEQTIGAAYTDGKMRQVWLDAVNMVAGDQFRIRVYVTINSVSRVYREWYLSDAYVSEPNILIPGTANFSSISFTIQRISATNRAFGFQVEELE
jgi:hypothetical protein